MFEGMIIEMKGALTAFWGLGNVFQINKMMGLCMHMIWYGLNRLAKI
jgi:hypothetical protein